MKRNCFLCFSFSALIWLASLPVAAQNANDITAKIAAAKAIYKQGDMAGAVKSFEDLSKAYPDSVEVQAWLGFLYLRSRRPQEAIPPLEFAAKARPKDLEVNNDLGGAYLGAGLVDKALDQYRYVEKLSPKLEQVEYNIGTIFLKKKNYPEAANAFQKAITLDPTDSYAMNNLGIALERVGQIRPAAETYTKASNMQPGQSSFAKNAGLAWYASGSYEQAALFMERARNDGDKSDDLALNLADCLSRNNKALEALKVYQSVEGSQSKRAGYWFNIGVLENQLGNSKGAEEAYRKAYAIDGNDLDTLNNLGMLLYKQQNYTEAEVLFDRLTGLNANSSNAWHNLAAAATRAGDKPKAIAGWRGAVKLNPSVIQDRLELANLLVETNELDEAAYHYKQILLVSPNKFEALNGLGLVELRQTHLANAEKDFRAAIHANPKFVPAYNNLALTLEKRNHRKQAIILLTHAAHLAPKDVEVQKNLKRMLEAGH